MHNGLTHLSETEIRNRCSEASFDRGQRYYPGDAVQQRMQHDDGIEARLAGSRRTSCPCHLNIATFKKPWTDKRGGCNS